MTKENLIKELIDTINKGNDYISVSLKERNVSFHNIINPNEMTITDNEISIESGNFIANIEIDDNAHIIKEVDEYEEYYVFKSKEMEIYITLL